MCAVTLYELLVRDGFVGFSTDELVSLPWSRCVRMYVCTYFSMRGDVCEPA